MYTKEELESMDIPQLVGIADQLGIKVSPDDQMEDVVYAILDKAAENSAVAEEAPKRKRTRIAKKDTSKVYTVKGEDGENLDAKSNRKTKKAETPSLFSDEPVAAPVEEPAPAAPKRRGRPSKAQLAAEEAARKAEEEAAQAQEMADAVPEASDYVVPESGDFVVPEAGNFESSAADDMEATNAIEQLREQLSNRKEQQQPALSPDTDEVDENGVTVSYAEQISMQKLIAIYNAADEVVDVIKPQTNEAEISFESYAAGEYIIKAFGFRNLTSFEPAIKQKAEIYYKD